MVNLHVPVPVCLTVNLTPFAFILSYIYMCGSRSVLARAVDPHSFFSDPDPAVFLNADPDLDPGGKKNADPMDPDPA